MPDTALFALLHLPTGAPLIAGVNLLREATGLLPVAGFVAHGIGSLADARWVRHRVARVLPHVNDTPLLCSAVTLALLLHLNPLTTPWPAAKLIDLPEGNQTQVIEVRPASA